MSRLQLTEKGVPAGTPLAAVPYQYLVLLPATGSGHAPPWVEPVGPARLYRLNGGAWHARGELAVPAPGTKPVAAGSPAVVQFSDAQAAGVTYLLAVTFRELPGHARSPGEPDARTFTLCSEVELSGATGATTTVPAG